MIEIVKENLNFEIAIENEGNFSCDAKIQFHFPFAEKGVQAHEIWRLSTKTSLVN